MGRIGIYKSDVRQARAKLLAEGRYPSVDLVRVALGHTGSRTTIHRYLKELEAEEKPEPQASVISDRLQALVGQLSQALQEEADSKVEAFQLQYQAERNALERELIQMKQDLAAAQQTIEALHAQNLQATTDLRANQEALQSNQIQRAQHEEEIKGLKARLEEAAAHQASLEQKHEHAQHALEHFRAASKEQRDQEQRRQEEQVQYLQAEQRKLAQTLIVKQDELTQLNKENARLVSDKGQLNRQLHQLQTEVRDLKLELKGLPELHRRNGELQQQLTATQAELKSTLEQLARDLALREAGEQRIHQLELANAGLSSRLEGLEKLIDEFKSAIQRPERPTTKRPKEVKDDN